MDLFRIDTKNKGSLPIDKDVFQKSFDQWVKYDAVGQHYAESGIIAFDKDNNLKFFNVIAVLKTDDLRNDQGLLNEFLEKYSKTAPDGMKFVQ